MSEKKVVIIGAGPAGLTAAKILNDHGVSSHILEMDGQVGGISRTVEMDGWRFDVGGHRFFTKVQSVDDFWHEILGPEDFLLRPRMSRIYYRGKFFDYPLKPMNALRGLGIMEAIRCVSSYAWARVHPPKDQSTFEGWVASRFGWRLYRIFFKTYTEKVWGMPATSMPADWAAQRIKNLSLWKAVTTAILPSKRNSVEVVSLIEEFQYPKYGPGMMWERCAQLLRTAGTPIAMGSRVTRIDWSESSRLKVHTEDGTVVEATEVISSMPLGLLMKSLEPAPPKEVLEAADALAYRDFMTVALVVPQVYSFPDNWIYIHSPEVQVGRVQNYGSWSPYLIKEGRTCLGLEYFVNVGDELWGADDSALIEMAKRELAALNLVEEGAVEQGFVFRMPKAYPVYDQQYARNVDTIRQFIDRHLPQVFPVGRNGMHRYNNQDHSMLTAMFAAENIAINAGHDVWAVNVDEDYHEVTARESGTGRSAPVMIQK